MNTKYLEYLNSKEWLDIRIDLLSIRGKRCENCGNDKCILDIHHLTYKNIFNEEPEDLIILCRKCHKKEHSKKKELTLAQKVLKKKNRKKKRKHCA